MPEKNKKRLKVIILPQPVHLRGQIPVDDIAFFVLETPWDDDEDVSLPDPCPFLDLSLDPPHPLHAIVAPDLDMVCTHHQLGAGKLLAVLLFGQADADYRCTIRVEFRWSAGSIRISFWINRNNSVGIYKGFPA